MTITLVLFACIGVFSAFILFKVIVPWVNNIKFNKRLALYPMRSTAMFIIIDDNNKLVFANPATYQFITQHGYTADKIDWLLPEELVNYQKNMKTDGCGQQSFEYKVEQCDLECVLLRHPDVNQWDLHLIDISKRKTAEQALKNEMHRNQDSGLQNQHAYRKFIEQMVQNGTAFTLGQIEIRSYSKLLADSDFKKSQRVVKTLSSLLQTTGQEIAKTVRVFQLTEKSFGMVIPSENCSKSVEKLVETINAQLKTSQFSDQPRVSLDFGFTCFPADGATADEIIRNTRIALENSASQEFTDYMMFNNELGKLVERQNTLQNAMHSAILDKHFQLYFQPQYSLREKKIIGAEVLIRWQLNEQWISPSEFIPLAEHSGLILPLGDWVLTSVCHKAQQIIEMGFEDIIIAVNISPKQFSAPNFITMVKRALVTSGLAPRNLELEITEGVLFNKEMDTMATLNELHNMGLKLAIDDFGTGYSSLSYLQLFPVDKLKIDQSFVRNMHKNKADQSIVKSVIELGNELGVTLIAEGVEQQQQVDLLTEMGCDEIQGYWLSKPLDEVNFSQFLQKNNVLPKHTRLS